MWPRDILKDCNNASSNQVISCHYSCRDLDTIDNTTDTFTCLSDKTNWHLRHLNNTRWCITLFLLNPMFLCSHVVMFMKTYSYLEKHWTKHMLVLHILMNFPSSFQIWIKEFKSIYVFFTIWRQQSSCRLQYVRGMLFEDSPTKTSELNSSDTESSLIQDDCHISHAVGVV